ncbi:polysaccharide deacetylase family protein [Altericista sp. CCNU0014]|uniref:polysaccharide deacetylase family protein n=1 Tax=Altericista sp. CCNU0014 TaxID=3082949 RepID=UPI00384D2A3C
MQNTPKPSLEGSQPLTQATQPLPPSLLNYNLGKVAAWIEQPSLGLDEFISHFAGNFRAYFTPSVWPNLNGQARQARVPAIMYHDITDKKKVFFDVTPQDFEAALKSIQKKGLTPISVEQLLTHLRTGLPLPEKPILLTFDDGYAGHYSFVYPLLKKYQYPGMFSIYTDKIDKQLGRPGVTWAQLKEMAADPLVTISAHSVTHPKDLSQLPDDKLQYEVRQSKRVLEGRLGVKIHVFTYPEGNYDARVTKEIEAAGYWGAFTMDDNNEGFAGQSESLLAIKRFGQSSLPSAISQAWGGAEVPKWRLGFDFSAPVRQIDTAIGAIPFTMILGGRPTTIHAKTRYQVPEILAGTGAIAGVDGGFFSLESLDSNKMIGPVFSQYTGRFIPGNPGEISKLVGRPLVLINPFRVKFIPFRLDKHNTLVGVQSEMPLVTDAFVAAAWLVKNGEAQPFKTFGSLFDFDAARHRAFWGINQAGQPQIGVSNEPIGSVDLGKALAKLGFRDAVMLDSGASTSLAYKGESLVGYTPRPVPHVVALVPPLSEICSPARPLQVASAP